MNKSLDKFILYLQEKLFGYLYKNPALKELKRQKQIFDDCQSGKCDSSQMVSPFEVFSTITNLAEMHMENSVENEENLRAMHGFFMLTDEDIPENNQIFLDFETLSKELVLSNIRRKEMIDVLMIAVENNLKILKQFNYENSGAFLIEESPYICQLFDFSAIKDGFKEEGLFDVEFFDELLDDVLNDRFKKDFKESYDTFFRMKEIYSKGIENMTEEDINYVIEGLKKYGTTDELIEIFKWVWNEQKKKQENKINENTTKSVNIASKKTVSSESKNKKSLNEKEYKKMVSEVKSTVEEIKNKTCELSYEEIIEFGKKLMLTGYCDEQNAILLMNQAGLKEKEVKENPVLDYISMYNKLRFYEHKEFIYEELENIEECIKSMMICSDEDYTAYKEMIEEEMLKIREKLFYKDEYERNLIKVKC